MVSFRPFRFVVSGFSTCFEVRVVHSLKLFILCTYLSPLKFYPGILSPFVQVILPESSRNFFNQPPACNHPHFKIWPGLKLLEEKMIAKSVHDPG